MKISQFDVNQYLPPEEAGKILHCSRERLGNLRFAGKGPAYSKIGRAIRYRFGDLIDYMEKNRVEPRKSTNAD